MNSYITFDQGLILVKLLIAHLFTDFIAQPEKWIDDKKRHKHKSPYLYYHATIAGLSSYLLLMQWNNWYVPLLIAFTHYIIDVWKQNREDNLIYFLIDQSLHVVVILIAWFTMTFSLDQFTYLINLKLNDHGIWLILFGFLFVIFPAQYLMKYATRSWSKLFEDSDKDALKDAGKWIGIFERILILILVINNQYGAIGFLVAGKSFVRFSDKSEKTRAQTEYILIGTLMSFTIAIGTGAVIAYFLEKL